MYLSEVPQLQEVKLERAERKVTMGTSVDPAVAKALDALAYAEHRSTAALIREAVHLYLQGRGIEVPDLDE